MRDALGRAWVFCGALNGLAAVGLAAVAAHAPLAPDRLAALRSGVEIEGWHAAALLFCSVQRGRRLVDLAGGFFLAGTLLFCAGVYAVAFGGVHLGPVAPSGGILLMLGWLLLATSAFTPGSRSAKE